MGLGHPEPAHGIRRRGDPPSVGEVPGVAEVERPRGGEVGPHGDDHPGGPEIPERQERPPVQCHGGPDPLVRQRRVVVHPDTGMALPEAVQQGASER
jgi:hypothetical protein